MTTAGDHAALMAGILALLPVSNDLAMARQVASDLLVTIGFITLVILVLLSQDDKPPIDPNGKWVGGTPESEAARKLRIRATVASAMVCTCVASWLPVALGLSWAIMRRLPESVGDLAWVLPWMFAWVWGTSWTRSMIIRKFRTMAVTS